MNTSTRRWTWYGQALDLALALAGLGTVAAMVWRGSYPLNGILLVAFCTGSITAGQLIELLLGRWTAQRDLERETGR